MNITKDQIYKLRRKARRNVALELGIQPVPAKVHKTHKKDLESKKRNTLRREELE